MKRWKALVLLGTLCLGLLLPWQAAAQEEPAGQLAEESGAAGVTEQLDWDVQSVLEQLGLSVTAPDETGEKFTLSHIWQVFSDYLSGRISQPFAMLGGLLIGIVQSGANTYISSSMSDTFVYLILIVVLMLRPAGILGKNVGEKV